MKAEIGKRNYIIFILLCWLVYASAYFGRINYAATMVELIRITGVDKQEAGLVSSFFFFAYGGGQLINGFLSDKINSRRAIGIALAASAIINLLMPSVPSVSAMKYVWGLNGICQSVLWSNIIKLEAKYVPQEYVSKSIIIMSSSIPLGILLAYGLSALYVHAGAYQLIFYTAGGFMLCIAPIWLILIKRIESTAIEYSQGKAEVTPSIPTSAQKATSAGSGFSAIFALIFILAIANGFIKDGITTWLPTFIYDTFSLSGSQSILITLLLPVVALFGAYVAQRMNKYLNNYMLVMSLLYGIGTASLLIIVYFGESNLPLSVILFALLALTMSGVNNVLTASLPLALRGKGKSGAIAGATNTFCYVGSTLTAVSLGAVADVTGWQAVLLILLGACGLVTILSAAFSSYRFTEN